MRGRVGGWGTSLLVGMGSLLAAAPIHAAPDADEAPDFYDPRRREPPRPHRFRLGLQLDYVRLSEAVNPQTGNEQRFHWVPLQLDFAYQAQFLRYFMVRPSFAFGANVGNTFVSMPIVVHPQLHVGYQGALLGAAVGYGFFTPPIRNKDYVSTIRGGEGRPVIENAHHLHVEASVTTRVHRRRRGAPGAGALSFMLRLGAVHSTLRHFEVKNERWRFMFTTSVGWYFGDGTRLRERRAARRAARARTP